MIIGYPVMQILVVPRGRQHEPVLKQQVHGTMKEKAIQCVHAWKRFLPYHFVTGGSNHLTVLRFFSFHLNKINEVMYLPEPCNL